MIFIVFGIAVLTLILILAFANKFTPNSEMMNSFKKAMFKKIIISLSVISAAFFSYGIYDELTEEPPSLAIQVAGENPTVYGDIGEFGYYSNTKIKKDAETEIYFVSWKELDLEHTQVVVRYPSGKEEMWETELSPVEHAAEASLEEKHQILGIYKASPYSFEEKGLVQVRIMNVESIVNEDLVADFYLEVE